MADIVFDGVLPASLPSISSGQAQLFMDTTSSSTKPNPVVRWFDGTSYPFANDTLVVHLAGTETITGAKTFSALATFAGIANTGLTGATTSSRWVGGTASGAPSSGTFVTGDVVVDITGTLWICTAGGTPGTWSAEAKDSLVVHLAGTETITGAKTFSVSPTLSSLATTGLLHNPGGSGPLTSSLLVAADVTTNTLTNATLAQAPTLTVKGNNTSATANVADLTMAQLRVMLNQPINVVTDYGMKMDHRVVFDGACSSGTPGVITSATAAFVAADVGKRITLAGAGASGAMYVGTISSLNSGTSVNVSPSITTTVSAKGLQIHTDDLAAWNQLVSDVNALTTGTADIYIPRFGTNRSGISGDINAFTRPVKIIGSGSSYNHDIGDYTKGEGSCIAYVGASSATTGTFDAVLTFKPVLGVTAQAYVGPVLRDFWIDCRNGDQNQALFGIRLLSCHGFKIDNIFVMDPKASAGILGVIAPGTAVPNAASIGEEKGTDRGWISNFKVRILENQSAPAAATLTPTTTTSAITLSTSGQSLVLAAANGLDPSGYVWVMTTIGKAVLVNYTGGGGTTTITGCTVDLIDTIEPPITVSGSNVVQAVPANAVAMICDGDLTANTNLSTFTQWQVSAGLTWSPAVLDFRNCDSILCNQIVINESQGSTGNTNDGAINRIRKPGVRYHGSNTNVGLPARNNAFRDGDPGPGGVDSMGLLNTGAKMAFPTGPNYHDLLQLANAAPVPHLEQFAAFDWNPNGGVRPGYASTVSIAAQSVPAASTALLTGSVLNLGPQGFQPGMWLRWIIAAHPTTGAAVASSWLLKVGATGTTSDATIATGTLTGTATTTGGKITIDWHIRTIGAAATSFADYETLCGPATGLANALVVSQQPACATFNTVTSGLLYASIALTTGTGQVISVDQIGCFVMKGANP